MNNPCAALLRVVGPREELLRAYRKLAVEARDSPASVCRMAPRRSSKPNSSVLPRRSGALPGRLEKQVLHGSGLAR